MVRMEKLVASLFTLLLALSSIVVSGTASAERIRDLVTIEGVRDNALIGYGLVVGLDGTGDQTMQTPFTTQSLSNMLSQLGITVPPGTNMQLKNVAAVMVTAKLPPFAHSGQNIDVVVSSLGNAKSLRGGTLLMTPLKGIDNQVYALAQGNILVGGAGVSAGGNSIRINQLAGGRISNGAVIERELPTQFGQKGTLNLQLNNDDFSLAEQISDAVNRLQGKGAATPLDSRTVQLRLPRENSEQVRFLSQVQNLNIRVDAGDAKVIFNSRTGSVVMNRNVTLDSCVIAHGSLSVTVERQTAVNQPNTPLAGGNTVVTRNTGVGIQEQGGALQQVNASANLTQVVRALNVLGATPTDLMSILQAMETAGCLRAKLEII
ncbi:putative flagella basal body protein [Xenorhabdus bovienii str. feltiae Moldova]|uniref:Flagellar P-ring protein n=2 Tax=Xenorhabdus bovienii TaxID=40576 RepID=A0A077NW50_XENBV|nr:putative flagella basal body protein [Xenorhabdus bovienii str. feltiae Moldova]